MTTELSIVIPYFNAGECLRQLFSEIQLQLNDRVKYEIIFVDDGSIDDTWNNIVDLANNSSYVKGVRLQKNYGQHSAIKAGLRVAKGNKIVVMDGDLQDDPSTLYELFESSKSSPIVFVRRNQRVSPMVNRIESKLFYWFFNLLRKGKHDETVANYGIITKEVAQELMRQKKPYFIFPFAVNETDYPIRFFEGYHRKRYSGVSSYSFGKKIRFAYQSIVNYSSRLLLIGYGLGFIYFSMFIFLLIHGNGISGFEWMVHFGILAILVCLSIMGSYIELIFNGHTTPDSYLVKELVNTHDVDHQVEPVKDCC